MSGTGSARGRRTKKYTAPALEKGLDILEALSLETDGLTSKEVSSALGKPMGQLFRMLVVLQQRGYVAYEAQTERYFLTLKLFDIANRLAPVRKLTHAATPLLRQLSESINQSCHIVIYYGGKGHIVVQQDAPSERIISVRLGAEAPLADTCSGHVLLAFADDERRANMIAAIPSYHRKPAKLAIGEIVKRIQENGFESIRSAQIQGVQDVGFPVFNHVGEAVAALVVPFVEYLDGSHPVKLEEAREMIRATAAMLSQRLGQDPNDANS